MSITLIAAMASNRAIGQDNKLLWRLPSEMAHFRRSTTGKTVLMGRKTFESLGRPLPNRLNVILTHDQNFVSEGCESVHSVDEALRRYNNEEDELMVIGGAEIYSQFLPYADKLLLTEVEAEIAGDAFFPAVPESEWSIEGSEPHVADEKHAYNFCIRTYRRTAPNH
ncbi:dihydrofolate reductase [Paenibacillus mendelii]|uniref:Dihydrofolate reductase n=1 Tax=Paenibacillus mendelii TaxID=206163 RepID=A0ABV6J5T7_9BACL|nr:dihydrofolate reductase [Paenibacillus mendelii]MCQ6560135.1 dihydrofolate reductase [Paenibacillus mendelii]